MRQVRIYLKVCALDVVRKAKVGITSATTTTTVVEAGRGSSRKVKFIMKFEKSRSIARGGGGEERRGRR